MAVQEALAWRAMEGAAACTLVECSMSEVTRSRCGQAAGALTVCIETDNPDETHRVSVALDAAITMAKRVEAAEKKRRSADRILQASDSVGALAGALDQYMCLVDHVESSLTHTKAVRKHKRRGVRAPRPQPHTLIRKAQQASRRTHRRAEDRCRMHSWRNKLSGAAYA